ncbi:MAG: 9-O-acetylesterase, partial [Rhodopirellula sp. JB044]
GEDQNFVEANAGIDGDTVVVSSEKVSDPVSVRYAWGSGDMPNLSNKEGLPASSFRTDDWPVK